MPPKLIFGTATFGMPGHGAFEETEAVVPLMAALKELGIKHLDTGARYPPPRPGRSEEIIGETGDGFVVDTKVYTDMSTDGSGDLEKGAMEKSVEDSLKRLKRERVNVLYIHRADPSTPLIDQVRNFNEQIRLGHCTHWGVSNTPPATLQEMLTLCDEHGFQKPRFVQGSYSLITRGMEAKLLPIMRPAGMSFVGHQPLAAGFLTGKFVNDEAAGTRFDPEEPLGQVMRKMFSGDGLVDGMRRFDAGVRERGLSSPEVAIRWLMHHSALTDEDSVILGASRIEQIRETVGFTQKGPLPDDVVAMAEELWKNVEDLRGDVI